MTDSDNLEFRKRSRRRLVGAAALALLAAVVLPMIMDDEPGLPVQDIQVTIPDRNADSIHSRPIGNRPAPASEPEVAPAPQEQPPALATVRAPDGGGSSESAATSAEPGERGSAGAPDARPPGAQKEAERPAAVTRTPDEAARVRAILEGKPVAAAPPRAFVVQVGAFSDAAKAASFGSDLKGKGFSAYTEQSGSVTRVRVGPFASRDEAERAAARLEALGFSGVVTSR